MINKIITAIKEDERALINNNLNDYEKGILVGEHDALISVLDAIGYQHNFKYIDNPD